MIFKTPQEMKCDECYKSSSQFISYENKAHETSFNDLFKCHTEIRNTDAEDINFRPSHSLMACSKVAMSFSMRSLSAAAKRQIQEVVHEYLSGPSSLNEAVIQI